MSLIIDKLKMLSEIISTIEEKLGLFKFIQYSLFIGFIYVIFNFPSVVESVIKIETELAKKEHEKRLLMRDNLMTELSPLLVELRSGTGASRALYFEYHNSTENFVGIPFKFANLVLSNQTYGCPSYDMSKYKDINSGLISGIYDELKKDGLVINKGLEIDDDFYSRYPEIHNFFSSQDGSKQQVFINIPGVDFPIGMIVLEWMDENSVKTDEEWDEIEDIIHSEVSRVNALISKYTP